MFNDSMRGVSTLSYSLLNSARDMIVRNNVEEVISDHVQFINDAGDIYIPFSKKFSIFNDDSSPNKFPTFYPNDSGSTDFHSPTSFQEFSKTYLDPEIATIKYDKSISLPYLLQQLAEADNVYGVVLQDPKKSSYAINPLHPMVAFLISAGLLELPEEGHLHIYEWNPSLLNRIKRRSNIEKEIEGYISDYEKFFAFSPHIVKEPVTIKQQAGISGNDITSLIEDPFVETLSASIRITREDTGTTDLSKIASLVIPHQLIADGTLSPYYGISLIADPTTSSISGYSITPSVTGNINQHHDGGERSFSSFYRSSGEGNVCTGSENSITPKGWFTLSRVNLNSMYYNDVISEAYVFPFIAASKKISADIWKVTVDETAQKLKEMEEA